MALGTSNRDGGRTSESGHLRALLKGVKAQVLTGLNVTQRGAGANMSVDVQIGDALIPRSDGTYGHPAWADAITNVTVTTADPSNPRRDIVVMYIDYSVTPSTGVSNNTNGVVKLAIVAGTPAGSPSDPSNAAIQSAVGASNPFIKLARIRVGAGVSSITNSVIDDLRLMATGIQQGGWVFDEVYSWSYLSATSFAITGVNLTSIFTSGLKIKLNQGGTTKYFVVTSSSFSTNTTVNLATDGTNSLSNVPIDKPAFSYAERPEGYPYSSISNPDDWYQELGRAKLTSAGSVITVGSFSPKRYLRILTTGNANGGTLQIGVRFNNDSSTIYNFGYLTGTASSGAIGTQSSIAVTAVIVANGTWDVTADIINTASLNKQILVEASHDITNIGNGYAPGYQKTFGKWVNTSSQINRIDLVIYSGTGNFAAGSELIVLGHD